MNQKRCSLGANTRTISIVLAVCYSFPNHLFCGCDARFGMAVGSMPEKYYTWICSVKFLPKFRCGMNYCRKIDCLGFDQIGHFRCGWESVDLVISGENPPDALSPVESIHFVSTKIRWFLMSSTSCRNQSPLRRRIRNSFRVDVGWRRIRLLRPITVRGQHAGTEKDEEVGIKLFAVDELLLERLPVGWLDQASWWRDAKRTSCNHPSVHFHSLLFPFHFIVTFASEREF